MKKLHLLFVILVLYLFSTGASFAQFETGIYAGLVNGKFKGDKPENAKYKSGPGFTAGISIDWWFAQHVALSLQPGIISMGSNVQFEDSTSGEYVDSISVNITAASLPVFFKINSMSERIYFLAGLDFVFLLSASGDNGVEEADLKNNINDLNVTMNFGFGYRIPVKRSSINLELRYAQGLLNITDALNDPDAYLLRIKTTAIKFVVAWKMPIGKK